jgi:glycosyltransferase involved in cell wall biosynthesis
VEEVEAFQQVPSAATTANRPGGGAPDLGVLILTFNEARHIERSIASVRDIAREIVVVDGFSTDGTAELAAAAGARVLRHKFENYSRQFQWGLDHGGIATEWIMRLDADEIIEADLAREIAARLPTMEADVAGINFDRKHVFMGRWIRHGGRYPLTLLRLWRRRQGRIEDRWMDEHIVIWGGRTIKLAGGFADVSLHDLTFFTDKHNKYATREATDVLVRKYGLATLDEAVTTDATSRQASLKRWIKERVYNRLPFWAGPTGYFLYRYFGQLGFLDGRPGLIYHFLQGFWYRFLVAAKVVELDGAIAGLGTAPARRARLAELTGLALEPAAEDQAGVETRSSAASS